MDVVNPYFRSREKSQELEELGVRVISSSIKGSNADLPSLSGDINTPILDTSYDLVIDLGGDNVGARVLGRYREDILNTEYDMFMVVNANRPETQSTEQVINYIKSIEESSGLKISGLINNTHLLKGTTLDDVIRGNKLVLEVSEKLNIPLKYTACIESVGKELDDDILKTYFPIGMYLREVWMS